MAEDPRNLELTREYIRNGFRVLERESHELDVHGKPKGIFEQHVRRCGARKVAAHVGNPERYFEIG